MSADGLKLLSCHLTVARRGTRHRKSWRRRAARPELCGLWLQTRTSCGLILWEKGTGRGFAVSCSELFPRPCPPGRDEAANAAPPATRHALSCSSSVNFSVLDEEKTRNLFTITRWSDHSQQLVGLVFLSQVT